MFARHDMSTDYPSRPARTRTSKSTNSLNIRNPFLTRDQRQLDNEYDSGHGFMSPRHSSPALQLRGDTGRGSSVFSPKKSTLSLLDPNESYSHPSNVRPETTHSSPGRRRPTSDQLIYSDPQLDSAHTSSRSSTDAFHNPKYRASSSTITTYHTARSSEARSSMATFHSAISSTTGRNQTTTEEK